MNRNNVFDALMDSFDLTVKEMALFCDLELTTVKEYKRFQNAKFTNGELSSLYFFFGVETCQDIYEILYAMSKKERNNILGKIKVEITLNIEKL